jgi:hypothetical protein
VNVVNSCEQAQEVGTDLAGHRLHSPVVPAFWARTTLTEGTVTKLEMSKLEVHSKKELHCTGKGVCT